jgi:hypothetical protein
MWSCDAASSSLISEGIPRPSIMDLGKAAAPSAVRRKSVFFMVKMNKSSAPEIGRLWEVINYGRGMTRNLYIHL